MKKIKFKTSYTYPALYQELLQVEGNNRISNIRREYIEDYKKLNMLTDYISFYTDKIISYIAPMNKSYSLRIRKDKKFFNTKNIDNRVLEIINKMIEEDEQDEKN